MKIYKKLESRYKNIVVNLERKSTILSFSRLGSALLFLIFAYFLFNSNSSLFYFLTPISLLAYIGLMLLHAKAKWELKYYKNLVKINQNETAYLEGDSSLFSDGIEYVDPHHEYAYDLDIFGKGSLFQHLNRTVTYVGKTKLANMLLRVLSQGDILKNQKAIEELAQKLDWRQRNNALGLLCEDTKKEYDELLEWANFTSPEIKKPLIWVSYLSPILLVLAMGVFLITGEAIFKNISYGFVLLNLFFISLYVKKIKDENITSDTIHDTIKSFAFIIKNIEDETFETEKLRSLQKSLLVEGNSLSFQIQELSKLFSKLDSLGNILGATLFNGLFLYHFHTMIAMKKWKSKNAKNIENWMGIIAEFETISSLANFSYNNPEFIFPIINKARNIEFEALGHPLISEKNRVCNSVDFTNQKLVILTGSNMSGKSTFLRTLGINMVLSGVGAPICAEYATIHPMKVLVSMRLSDSLTENESYFFAEVKRLKQIVDILEKEDCFVLLDEILRGTNSEDKSEGTIAVIKKLIYKNAIGIIATHDLEVCLTTNEYPDYLSNKCFEAQINNNELFFDYKLRDGICKNKSASFLMKKMKVV